MSGSSAFTVEIPELDDTAIDAIAELLVASVYDTEFMPAGVSVSVGDTRDAPEQQTAGPQSRLKDICAPKRRSARRRRNLRHVDSTHSTEVAHGSHT